MRARRIGRVKSGGSGRAKARRLARLISADHDEFSMEGKYCKHPDADHPGLECGHPLPCPRHTLRIDMDADPPTITIPVTAIGILKEPERLSEIARIIREEKTA